MKYQELPSPPPPLHRARPVSPLTPRQQRMLDQARRWRAQGLGDREQRRRDLRIMSALGKCPIHVPDAWISTPEFDHHVIATP